MEFKLLKPGRLTRLFYPWFTFLWRWSFRLLTYGLMLWVLLNWSWISLRLYLTPESSLVRHLGWLLVAMAGAQLLASLVHELGHLVAGRVARLHLHMFMIGPVQLIKERSGRIKLRLRRGLGIFNGLTASIPSDGNNIRRRMLAFALGGPIASLLLALFGGLLFWWILQKTELYEQRAWVWELVLLGAFFSFTTLLSTMRPGSYGNGYQTDGGRIATLLENGEKAHSWYAQVMLNAADIQGVRPREWDETLVTQMLADRERSVDALMGLWLAYFWALDKRDWQRAALYLDGLLHQRFRAYGGFKVKIILEQGFFFAWHERDLQKAEEWMLFLKRPSRPLWPQYYRTKTAVALLQGSVEEAEGYWQQAYDAYQNVEHQGGIWLAEVALLQEMREALLTLKTQKAS